ncbi:MAG: hypothetical protein HDT15_12075 [Oscillibacter sp.]|nr:hypothetical protein [Oscillibacter sp.]
MEDTAKVCPLMSVGRFAPAPCVGKSCAWWDRLCGECCMAIGADAIRDVGDHINVLNMILEKGQDQGEE